MLVISRVHDDHIFNTVIGNVIYHPFNKVSVGINNGQAFAAFHILNYHVLKKCRFTGTGFPDDVKMSAAVIPTYPKLH